MSTLIFVYGSLKSSSYNYKFFLSDYDMVMSTTTTEKYLMVETKDFPYLCLSSSDDSLDLLKKKVRGEVYRVDEHTIGRLDRLEGYPRHYDKTEIQVDGMDEMVTVYHHDLTLGLSYITNFTPKNRNGEFEWHEN
jgi:gamma-glutamylcyclotransferase (GGCT)/AIG2-like uncharacterized protein YtfP